MDEVPGRIPPLVQVQHDPMSMPARTLEHRPFELIGRPDNSDGVPGQRIWNLVHAGDVRDLVDSRCRPTPSAPPVH
jgi:hypothetical protein